MTARADAACGCKPVGWLRFFFGDSRAPTLNIFIVAVCCSIAAHADLLTFSINGADNLPGVRKVTGSTTINTTSGSVLTTTSTTSPSSFVYSVITGQIDQGDVFVQGTDGTAKFTFTDPLRGTEEAASIS